MEIEKYLPKMRELAIKICKDDFKADDAVSDATLEILEGGMKIDEDGILKITKKYALRQVGTFSKEILFSGLYESEEGAEGNFSRKIEARTSVLPQQEKEEEKFDHTKLPTRKGRRGPQKLPYESARLVARKLSVELGIRTSKQWRKYFKKNPIEKLPFNPHISYKHNGWRGWDDWLGKTPWMTFEEARNYILLNMVPKGIDSEKKWFRTEIPEGIPHNPSATYKGKGWVSWPHFFGREGERKTTGRFFISYTEAREWVRINRPHITSGPMWYLNTKDLPKEIPANPDIHYRKLGEWKGWGHFLQTGRTGAKDVGVKKKFRPYKEAREWVRLNLRIHGIDSWGKWKEYIKGTDFQDAPRLPDDIPRALYATYKGEWKSSDFFGVVKSNFDNREFWPYNKTREWVHKNIRDKGVISGPKWNKWASGKMEGIPKRPDDIPFQPQSIYKEWEGWRKFLGTEMMCYEDAKKWTSKNIPSNITSTIKWNAWRKEGAILPLNFPRDPQRFYKGNWKGWKDFVGNKAGGWILPYEEARQYVQKHLVPKGINTSKKYDEMKNRPKFLPHKPHIYYGKKRQWKGVNDFFGKSSIVTAKVKMSIGDAIQWIKENLGGRINNIEEWRAYIRGEFPDLSPLHPGIPKVPDITYSKEEWVGYKRFLTAERKKRKK